MRIRYMLWKVANGFLLVPDDCTHSLNPSNAPDCHVFKSLKEFSDWKPKRVRNKRSREAHKAKAESTPA